MQSLVGIVHALRTRTHTTPHTHLSHTYISHTPDTHIHAHALQSTLFNAIVENGKAAAANFPFCTIEPNTGIVTVPDARLQVCGGVGRPHIWPRARLFVHPCQIPS